MRMKTIENLDTGYQDIKINLNGTKSINVTKTKDNTDTIHTMPIKDELVGNYKQKINLIIDKFIHECKLNNYIVEKINGNQIFTIKRIDGKKLELRGLNIDTLYLEPIIYKYNLDYIDTLIQNLINNPNYRIVINMTKNQTNMGIEDNVLYLVLNENEKSVNDYLSGQDRAFKYLMGQIMKETKGNANPSLVNQMLTQELNDKKN